MPLAPFFTEALFNADPEREKLPRSSPYSIIEHPFRVLVHSPEFDLLAVGTAALGSAEEPTRVARLYAESRPDFWSAIILARNDHTLIRVVVVKPTEVPHAESE